LYILHLITRLPDLPYRFSMREQTVHFFDTCHYEKHCHISALYNGLSAQEST
jgi:hypothetical protein